MASSTLLGLPVIQKSFQNYAPCYRLLCMSLPEYLGFQAILAPKSLLRFFSFRENSRLDLPSQRLAFSGDLSLLHLKPSIQYSRHSMSFDLQQGHFDFMCLSAPVQLVQLFYQNFPSLLKIIKK